MEESTVVDNAESSIVGSRRRSQVPPEEVEEEEWTLLFDKNTNRSYYQHSSTMYCRYSPPPQGMIPTPADAYWVKKIDPEGKPYFYNKLDKSSILTVPDVFEMDIQEIPLPDPEEEVKQEDTVLGVFQMQGWRIRIDQASGLPFYYNYKLREYAWFPTPTNQSKTSLLEAQISTFAAGKRRSLVTGHVTAEGLPSIQTRRSRKSSITKGETRNSKNINSLTISQESNVGEKSLVPRDASFVQSDDDQDDVKDNIPEEDEEGIEMSEHLDADNGGRKTSGDGGAAAKRVRLELTDFRKGWVKRTLNVGPVYEDNTMLSFKKSLIKKALLKKNRDFDKEAMQSFKNVMSYMGDRKSTKSPVDHVRKIIKNALDYGMNPEQEGLKDEIYLQICKQVTNHPLLNHAIRGWELMTICLGSFAPTDQMRIWLEDFYSGVRDDEYADVAIKDLTDHCLVRLEHISRTGDRNQVPTPQEVILDQEGKKVPVPIYTPNGNIISVEADCFITVQQVLELLMDSLQVAKESRFMFCIVERHRSGQDKFVDVKERLLDVTASWFKGVREIQRPVELSKTAGDVVFREEEPYRLILRAHLVLPYEEYFGEDEAALSLVYTQAISDMVEERYPVMMIDCLKIAAYQLQESYGDYKENQYNEDWVASLLGQMVPKGALQEKKGLVLRRNAALYEAAGKVLEKYKTLHGRTGLECRRVVLETMESWPCYGAYMVSVEQNSTSAYPGLLRLGVSYLGLLLISHKSGDIIALVPYTEIVSFGGSDKTLHYICRENSLFHFHDQIFYRTSKAHTVRQLCRLYHSKSINSK